MILANQGIFDHGFMMAKNPNPASVPSVPAVSVAAASSGALAEARSVAVALSLPFADLGETQGLQLVVSETEAWLDLSGTKVTIQFDSGAMLHRRRGGQNELLGRAVGVKAGKCPAVFDATGGLGRDAFVLADLGCEVTLCEQAPVLQWLLQRALATASVSRHDSVREAAARMRLIAGNSENQSVPPASVIYLDPMFPERKKLAAVKKEAQALQAVSLSHDQGAALWQWAWQQPVERIVVKRPLRAPLLGRETPSHSLAGRSVRYDVFVRSARSEGV